MNRKNKNVFSYFLFSIYSLHFHIFSTGTSIYLYIFMFVYTLLYIFYTHFYIFAILMYFPLFRLFLCLLTFLLDAPVILYPVSCYLHVHIVIYVSRYIYTNIFSFTIDWFAECRWTHIDESGGCSCKITLSLLNKARITTILY